MRLTKKMADNGRFYLSGFAEVSNYYPKGFGRIQVGYAVEKLAEYEDLEEQGKLLRLPCVVGDIIYVIPSKTNYKLNILNGHKENNRVYQQEVNRIEIFRDGYLLSTCDGMQSVIDKFYKETWFLTKKEAEAALKKMGG